ncbi:hypothetical protein A0J61_00830 [Choanephora cucurbitarum]|uniref:F-box domain-containing protein n=1 Tax=Choanephora cucurbitarum TaxID=101091 RepID=A0A1C7NPV1_9FUNG|nr:hypothetical protein A0J61_00830 [Choanephora cucurbitarum]
MIASSFFTEGIRVHLSDTRIEMLLNDLLKYKSFGPKITKVALSNHSTGQIEPTLFRSTLSLCPNLTEIEFDTNEIYHYLRALNSREALLPSIQEIRITSLELCSPAIRRFHVWLYYRFRMTITTLEITDANTNDALNTYGGLVAFIRLFPNLKHLKAESNTMLRDRSISIDLHALLTNAPQLESLELFFFNMVTSNIRKPQEPTEYSTLKRLKLDVSRAEFNTLDYITTRFKHLHNITFVASRLVPNNALTTSQEQATIDCFLDYCSKIEETKVWFIFRHRQYFKDNTNKCPIHHALWSVEWASEELEFELTSLYNDMLFDEMHDIEDFLDFHDEGYWVSYYPDEDEDGDALAFHYASIHV